jgi:hypothetical protein
VSHLRDKSLGKSRAMQTGYKCLRKKSIRARTNTRTSGKRRRGRELGSKNKSTLERELLAKQELLTDDLRAVNLMDEEIVKLGQLMEVLYPWDDEGKQLKGKSVNSYKWASELRRDFLALRAPYQSPRLSAVQVLPQQAGKRTTVRVTLLNERGEVEYSDVPKENDLKLIEGAAGDP